MANTREVFGQLKPHDPSKPRISVKLPSKEELIANILGLIPGYRALKNFHDNPEGPISETLDLAAEDLIPLYASLIKPAIKGEDIDAEQALKEAAVFGIPMPYIKYPKGHPKAGEPIPNNLKEGLGYFGWANAKSKWKKNRPDAKKLYVEPMNERSAHYTGGNTEGGLSTRTRVNSTSDAREAIEIPAGPYRETNTGSNVVNRGRQARNTNINSRNILDHGRFKGTQAWQGDMYPPGRSLRKDDMYGPFQWEDKYSRKLNNVIDENEYKWEYLINKTRPTNNHIGMIPKQDIADIAMAQGRPDIAARVMVDDKPRLSTSSVDPASDKRFVSYASNQRGEFKDNAKWKDAGNRQVEKELREEFASLPEDPDIRFRFADYYGVPDLYESWMNDPLIWAKHKNDTQHRRYTREVGNRSARRRAGWDNPNQ